MIRADGTIRVQVGSTPKIAQYSSGGDYLDYGYKNPLDINVSLDSLMRELQSYKDEFGGEYSDFQIEDDDSCSCRGDCSCRTRYYVTGIRKALPIEIEYFRKRDEDAAAARVARDRADYERLKSQFGDSQS